MRPLRGSGAYDRSAEEVGLAAAEALGVENKDGSVERLREIPADQLVGILTNGRIGAVPRPNRDGWVLPNGVCEAFRAGEHNDVPVIVGWNADEATNLVGPFAPTDVSSYREEIRDQYGEMADEFLELYSFNSVEEGQTAYLESWTDGFVGWQMHAWARTAAHHGRSPAYLYLFSRVPPGATTARYGAYHMAEVFYVFGKLSLGRPPFEPPRMGFHPYEELDHELSETMMSYWVNFATSGDPNSDGLPAWSAYSDEKEELLELGDTVETRRKYRAQYFDLWDRYFGPDCSLLRDRP